MSGDNEAIKGLPLAILSHADDPSALRYLTRGLTSNIYALELPPSSDDGSLERRLSSLGASTSSIVVKCVDLEDEAKPHDVLKEVRILQSLGQGGEGMDGGRRYVLSLLDTTQTTPDDFTTLQRLFLPHYPSTLADWLIHDAQEEGNSSSSGSTANDTRTGARTAFVARLSHQLFSALAHLHSHGITHRDIKPSNLLLTSPASSALSDLDHIELRLCDFGTAHEAQSQTQPAGSQARPKTCSTSTHPYTPPELLFSPQEGYDGAKVDTWEAGCVIAEFFGKLKETTPDRVEAPRAGRIGEWPGATAGGVGGAAGGGGGRLWPSAALDFGSGAGAAASSKRPAPDDHGGGLGPPPRLSGPSSSALGGSMMLGSAFDDGAADDEEDEDEFWKKQEADLFSGEGANGAGSSNGAPQQQRGGGGSLFAKWLPKDSATSRGGFGDDNDDDDDDSPFGTTTTHQPAPATRTYTRLPLFGAQQGDLGLASDIFTLLGLPEAHESHLWPEATNFRPPLDRMPFVRKKVPGREELRGRLGERLVGLGGEGDGKGEAIMDVLLGCLCLSAGERWDAGRARDRLADAAGAA